jgi:hypothetical protein
MKNYTTEIEEQMRKVYEELTEKDRRIYIASEAIKLGYGGKSYISRVFGCSRNTLNRGLSELKNGTGLPKGRLRKKGGGRKKTLL